MLFQHIQRLRSGVMKYCRAAILQIANTSNVSDRIESSLCNEFGSRTFGCASITLQYTFYKRLLHANMTDTSLQPKAGYKKCAEPSLSTGFAINTHNKVISMLKYGHVRSYMTQVEELARTLQLALLENGGPQRTTRVSNTQPSICLFARQKPPGRRTSAVSFELALALQYQSRKALPLETQKQTAPVLKVSQDHINWLPVFAPWEVEQGVTTSPNRGLIYRLPSLSWFML